MNSMPLSASLPGLLELIERAELPVLGLGPNSTDDVTFARAPGTTGNEAVLQKS